MEEGTAGGGKGASARERGQVRVFMLRALDRCNGQPMPRPTMEDTVSLAFPHVPQAVSCADQALEDLRAAGMIAAVERPIDGMELWVLTDKGRGVLATMPTR